MKLTLALRCPDCSAETLVEYDDWTEKERKVVEEAWDRHRAVYVGHSFPAITERLRGLA